MPSSEERQSTANELSSSSGSMDQGEHVKVLEDVVHYITVVFRVSAHSCVSAYSLFHSAVVLAPWKPLLNC